MARNGLHRRSPTAGGIHASFCQEILTRLVPVLGLRSAISDRFALSVAAEFLSMKAPQGPLSDMSILEVKQKLEAMHGVLDNALMPQENLF